MRGQDPSFSPMGWYARDLVGVAPHRPAARTDSRDRARGPRQPAPMSETKGVVPITSLLYTNETELLLDDAEERGFVDAHELEALVERHELEQEDADELTRAFEDRGIEIRASDEEGDARTENDDAELERRAAESTHLPSTADSLQ